MITEQQKQQAMKAFEVYLDKMATLENIKKYASRFVLCVRESGLEIDVQGDNGSLIFNSENMDRLSDKIDVLFGG